MITHKGFLGKFWSASLFLVMFGVLVSPVFQPSSWGNGCEDYDTVILTDELCLSGECDSYGRPTLHEVCITGVSSGAETCNSEFFESLADQVYDLEGCDEGCDDSYCTRGSFVGELSDECVTNCSADLNGECAVA